MLLIEICTNGWEAHGSHSGSQESKENGRRWPLRSVCKNCVDAKWKEIEEEENVNQEVHSQSVLQRIIQL